MPKFNQLTIDRLPARIEYEAKEKGLSFDLPPWDEFKKDVDTGMSVLSMKKKWGNVHWTTMRDWVQIYKDNKQEQ